MFIIWTAVWVNGWGTSSVASRAISELTSSQCSWKGNQKGKGTYETPKYSKYVPHVHTDNKTQGLKFLNPRRITIDDFLLLI